MGNKMNVSCLRPQYDDRNPQNRHLLLFDNQEAKNSRQMRQQISFQSKSARISNSFYKPKKYTHSYIEKVKRLQKHIRYALAVKKFNDNIDLLRNILELDSSINLIKDKNLENKLLIDNIGEQLSQKLLSTKKIQPYTNTKYYKINIKKYKPNQYLIKTGLTYIDKYKNNNLYIGTWTLEKKFLGYGIYYIEGNKYEGFWNFGKLDGECQYFLKNKDYFIGNFSNGQANGYGNYYHNDGTIYEGNWVDDRPNGKGKELFSDGSKFEGIFENGFKKLGKFKWIDGSFYDGEIKNNTFEGKGIFHWKEGKEYNGEWKEGKMNGKGIMNYVDGSKYEGEFINGKREGIGNYIWNENKYYKGGWLKGRQEGKGYYFNKGKGINGIWKDGKMIISLSSEMEKDIIIDKIIDDKSISPSRKYSRTQSRIELNDSINISTNQSSNSGKKVKLNNKKNNDAYQTSRTVNNKTKCNIKEKNSSNDISVISTSTQKSKVPLDRKNNKHLKNKKGSTIRITDRKELNNTERLYKTHTLKTKKIK